MNKLLLLVLIPLLAFLACEKDSDAPQPLRNNDPVFQTFQAMQLAEEEFIRIGSSLNVSPPEALGLTVDYARNLPGVTDVLYLDKHHLRIATADGYTNIISIDEVDENGLSVFRGSPGATANLTRFAGDCSNTIENKKVLLFAAAHDDFYSGNEYQTRVVDVIENGQVDVELTVLKNEECTPQIMQTFNDYGLVIMDTHGQLDAVLTGVQFSLIKAEIPGSVNAFHDMLRHKLGADNFSLLMKGQLGLGTTYKYDSKLQHQQIWSNYKKGLDKPYPYRVWITSKGVRELIPNLEGTILFANCCYSGFRTTHYAPLDKRFDPIQPAWMSKKPITYYGYEASNNKVSYMAYDSFCKINADTLIHSFFHAGDSTGQAHLFNDIRTNNHAWNLNLGWKIDEGPLNFNVYGNENWCYGVCGQDLVDERDGQVYKTVCIGDQVWMAENLNWAGAGLYYDNNPANGDIFGRLYSIKELTNLQVSTDLTTVQGLCPDGWHVPSAAELEELIAYSGGYSEAADKLRSSKGWPSVHSDELGFNFKPAGYFTSGEAASKFAYIGKSAYLWTSSKSKDDYYHLAINAYHPNMSMNTYSGAGWEFYFSCRCVKDE